jgi:hypothetical protein
MSITVRAYTKHLDGKLVTVHGYAAERNAAHELRNPAHTVITRQQTFRGEHMGISPPGQFMNPLDNPPMAGEGGLTAYMLHPGGHLTKEPVVRWRRTKLPIRGAYQIPKRGPR